MNIPQDKINNFALRYNYVNRELADGYISNIQSQLKDLEKKQLEELVEECKLNLADAFEKNIGKISEDLSIDFNVMVKNPLIEGGQTLLRDAVIVIIISPITTSIMKGFGEKAKVLLDSM